MIELFSMLRGKLRVRLPGIACFRLTETDGEEWKREYYEICCLYNEKIFF